MTTDTLAKLAAFAWCIESTDSADWCWSATLDGVKSNAQFLDEGCVPGEPFAVVRKSDHDERIARLLAHIDAQAVRLEAAEALIAKLAAIKAHDPNFSRTKRHSSFLTMNVPAALVEELRAAIASEAKP